MNDEKQSALMDRMMQAHSQCVVDDMCHRIKGLVETARDNGNFSEAEAGRFLVEVINEMPGCGGSGALTRPVARALLHQAINGVTDAFDATRGLAATNGPAPWLAVALTAMTAKQGPLTDAMHAVIGESFEPAPSRLTGPIRAAAKCLLAATRDSAEVLLGEAIPSPTAVEALAVEGVMAKWDAVVRALGDAETWLVRGCHHRAAVRR